MAVAETFEGLKGAGVQGVRAAIRSGRYTGHTAGLAAGKLQTNLAILPRAMAGDFRTFCERNARPCPLVGVTEPGSPNLPALGDIDLRTDVPAYNIYRDVKRPGFSGGCFIWVMRPYRGSLGRHSSLLLPRRAGCVRWGRTGGGC